MLREQVLPYLQAGSDTRLVSRCLYFYGIGESDLAHRLDRLMRESTNPTVAPYCKPGEVMLRVTARVAEGQSAGALLDPVVEEIRREAGEWLYGINVGNLQTALVHLLLAKELTIATAESCTGGPADHQRSRSLLGV